MVEIQRYEIGSASGTREREAPYGPWAKHSDHVAALAAQAEEHEKSDRLIASLVDRQTVQIEELRKELAEARGEGPALIRFERHRLIGEPCMIHRDFAPTMRRLVEIAINCDVKLWVTHSMRRLDQKLVGAIVKAAKRSNHHAGSAIDMNPVYQGVWYTSEMMANTLDLPGPVQKFLGSVMEDPDLRWGGQFGVNKDRVHIDSDLVRRDPDEWAKRVKEWRGET